MEQQEIMLCSNRRSLAGGAEGPPFMRLCTGLLECCCSSASSDEPGAPAPSGAPPVAARDAVEAGGGATERRCREPGGAIDTRFSMLGLCTTGDFMSLSNCSRVTRPSPSAPAAAACAESDVRDRLSCL